MEQTIRRTESNKKTSVRFKINLTVTVIFLVVVSLLMIYTYISDRSKNLELAISQVKSMNTFYFDALNTMMLTGSIADRAILRDKMLRRPGVLDMRVNRVNIDVTDSRCNQQKKSVCIAGGVFVPSCIPQ